MNSRAAFALAFFACVILLFGCVSQQPAGKEAPRSASQEGNAAQQAANQTYQQGGIDSEFDGADEGLAQSIEDLEQLK